MLYDSGQLESSSPDQGVQDHDLVPVVIHTNAVLQLLLIVVADSITDEINEHEPPCVVPASVWRNLNSLLGDADTHVLCHLCQNEPTPVSIIARAQHKKGLMDFAGAKEIDL